MKQCSCIKTGYNIQKFPMQIDQLQDENTYDKDMEWFTSLYITSLQ